MASKNGFNFSPVLKWNLNTVIGNLINKVLDVKPLVPFIIKIMPIV